MKTYKTCISCMAMFLFLMAGCGDNQQKTVNVSGSGKVESSKPFVIKSTGDFIIDINDGDNEYNPFRMLNQSDDLEKAESDAFEEAWSILDNAEWETAQVSMSRPADYRVEVVDKTDREKPVTTFYFVWANPEYKSIELVDYDNTRYVLLKKPDAEKLYTFLIGRNLSDHVQIMS